jgi:hypothetical protein
LTDCNVLTAAASCQLFRSAFQSSNSPRAQQLTKGPFAVLPQGSGLLQRSGTAPAEGSNQLLLLPVSESKFITPSTVKPAVVVRVPDSDAAAARAAPPAPALCLDPAWSVSHDSVGLLCFALVRFGSLELSLLAPQTCKLVCVTWCVVVDH